MKLHFKKFNTSSRGFTLVEALVAISIFSLSVIGLISVLANGISNTNYVKTKLGGAYLAQEGVEYIRNMRDTYVLYDATSAQNGWTSFNSKLTGASCQGVNGCYFDDQNLNYANTNQPMTGIAITACGTTCPKLLYSTTGKYGYASGTSSPFTRKITITQPTINETKITSTVFWTQGSGSYNIVFSESLFNWVE